MSIEVYVGVDGGGSKTKIIACDINENIVEEQVLEGLNINQIGTIGFEERVIEIFNLLKTYDVKQIVFGVPGYGENRKSNSVICEIINSYFGAINQIYNDVKVAHFGSFELKKGVQIVAGTGSIGYALGEGNEFRLGGYGPLIGDEGSAYAIGAAALNHMSLYFDKRIGKDKLIMNIMYVMCLDSMEKLIDYVYGTDNSRVQIASISEIVDMSSKQGCKQAQIILNNAAKKLADIALVLCGRVNLNNVSYAGSVFKSNFLLNEFTRILAKNGIKVVAPKFGPDHGALLKALEYKDKDSLMEEL